MRATVGAGGDGPDVAGVASVRVGGMPPTGAVPPRGNDLPGVRTVLGRPGRPARPASRRVRAAADDRRPREQADCGRGLRAGRGWRCGMRMGSRSNQ